MNMVVTVGEGGGGEIVVGDEFSIEVTLKLHSSIGFCCHGGNQGRLRAYVGGVLSKT